MERKSSFFDPKAYINTSRGESAAKKENQMNIEEIRKERGIRQEELAKMLGVSRQTVSSLENGRYNPSISLAFKVARCFGMSIEEIFIYEEEGR